MRKREYESFGDEILAGGRRNGAYKEFLEWAGAYDDGDWSGRSLRVHEAWLENLECDVVRVVNGELGESVKVVLEAIRG